MLLVSKTLTNSFQNPVGFNFKKLFKAQAAQDSFSSSNTVTSVGPPPVTSSPATGATVPPATSIPHNGLVGPPPHAPPHPPFHHPHGLPPHPHFHPHLGMEPPRPRFLFKMPRVVPNQKEKYESEDLMKRHSREGEVIKMNVVEN